MVPSLSTCVFCSNPPSIPCPDCSTISYCSEACRSADSAVHALICSPLVSPPPKPSPSHILGFLFPAEAGSAPSPAWVRLDKFVDEDTGISFQDLNISAFFPAEDGPAPASIYSERNRVRNRDTLSMLEVWNVTGGSEGENQSVAALAGARGPFYEWRGPVLVMAMTRSTGYMVDPGAYRDVTAVDFRDAVDFVVDHGNEAHGRRIREALETLGTSTSVTEVEDNGLGAEADGEAKVAVEAEDEATGSVVVEMAG